MGLMKKKICVITGSRAEYGLLTPLLKRLKNDTTFKLQLVVTGAHLSHEFGLTYQEIEKDGFTIDKKLEMLLSSDSTVGICKSMGLAFIGFADIYAELQPDYILILGDRYEIFCAAAVALIHKIPIIHLHGGELTEGLYDDAIRHAITKMSHYHFTSTETYRNRVIQLGEHPDTVFNVGAIGLDNIKHLNLLSKDKIQGFLNIRFKKRNLLITFHPVTLSNQPIKDQLNQLFSALLKVKDTLYIFTKANADNDGRLINHMIDQFVDENTENAVAFTSLGQLKYLSLMRYVDAVVGNSSSGIIEAPSFKVPTINIGNRQQGRISAESVIQCDPEGNSILKALNVAFSKKFMTKIKKINNPYGNGNTSEKIMSILKRKLAQNNSSVSMKKEFYNLI